MLTPIPSSAIVWVLDRNKAVHGLVKADISKYIALSIRAWMIRPLPAAHFARADPQSCRGSSLRIMSEFSYQSMSRFTWRRIGLCRLH